MINTKPVLGDMRLNVTDNLGKYEVFNGETWLIMENYDTIESLRAEIEALKKEAALQRLSDFTQEADNEPVAYGRYIENAKMWLVVELNEDMPEGYIPLYTHPVKDLEDIDINITWNENSMRDFGKDELAFAKAILRKAQEK